MKRFDVLELLLTAAFSVFVCGCENSIETVGEEPWQPSMPEIVEGEIVDILSRDWKSLVDTLGFFAEDMLSEGRTEGFGSDGVYYSLSAGFGKDTTAVTFCIQDSVWMKVRATQTLRHLDVSACSTCLSYDILTDSVRIAVQNIAATIPAEYPVPDDAVMPVTYRDCPVGYIGLRYLENTDYTVKRCPVMFYHGDTRSFGFYENLHFLTLLELEEELLESVE